MKKFRTLFVIGPLVCLLMSATIWQTAHAAGSSGGGGGFTGSTSAPERRAKSPEDIANGHYKAGLRFKAKAWKAEEKAAKATKDSKRDKLLADARKFYEKAMASQATAIKVNEQHYEAANELGYALRKTGDYRKAIGAYNYALQLRPSFYPAIEYRGEAFLMMGFIKESQEAYMTLFRNDRELADQLMATMEKWHAAQPDGDPKKAFADWLAERKQLASIGHDLSSNNTRTW